MTPATHGVLAREAVTLSASVIRGPLDPRDAYWRAAVSDLVISRSIASGATPRPDDHPFDCQEALNPNVLLMRAVLGIHGVIGPLACAWAACQAGLAPPKEL